jgi:hypothetical protein
MVVNTGVSSAIWMFILTGLVVDVVVVAEE